MLVTTASLASGNIAQPVKAPARWFEIEIILFKQISNKEQNKEQFSSQDLTAKKRYAIDLLAPYLQPDIASLKQLLPTCGQPSAAFPYDIEAIPFDVLSKKNSAITDASLTSLTVTKTMNNAAKEIESHTDTVKQDEELEQSATNTDDSNTSSMSVTVLPSAPDPDEVESSASEKSTAPVEHDYKVQYAKVMLSNYNQFPSDDKTPFCVIPAEFFQQNLTAEQLAQFNVDGFPVEKLTNTINGLEQWRDDENGVITWASNDPYLISQDSLRLKSIANRIKRSRNYKPLLHLGWRQIGETRRKAKAMKIYAGEHLELNYQQAIAEQAKLQTTLAIEAILEKRQQAEALIINQQVIDDNPVNDTANVASNITDKNATPERNLTSEALSSKTLYSDMSPAETLSAKLNTFDNIDVTEFSPNELSIEEELRQHAKLQQLDKIFKEFAQLSNENTEEITEGIVAQLSTDINTPVRSPLYEELTQDKSISIETPLQPWSLDGLFKVHLDHYLYINSELNLVEKSTLSSTTKNKADVTTPTQQIISFKQDRRVISGEIHYFDHPHIGMIVQIRRFDPTKPAAEAVSQSKK